MLIKIVIVIMVFVVVSLLIYYGSMKWLKVRYLTVSYDNLPEFLDGFKILHITDLHSNDTGKMNVDIWAAAEKLEFDIAVITGDIILYSAVYLTPHLDGLKKLAERVPVFFVEGNHDRWHLRDIKKLLDEAGVKTLLNEKINFSPGGNKDEYFEIIGLKDLYSQKNQTVESVTGLFDETESPFRLVLSHQPQVYDSIRREGPELVLSGHTHGGQLRLPFIPTLYAPGQGFFPKYGYGLYGDGNSRMYISKGIGGTVFNIRFWNRPEITVITLKQK